MIVHEVFDFSVKQAGSVAAVTGKGRFDVLQVDGAVYKGNYRMRRIYAQIPGTCALMGQEILETGQSLLIPTFLYGHRLQGGQEYFYVRWLKMVPMMEVLASCHYPWPPRCATAAIRKMRKLCLCSRSRACVQEIEGIIREKFAADLRAEISISLFLIASTRKSTEVQKICASYDEDRVRVLPHAGRVQRTARQRRNLRSQGEQEE